MSAKKVKWVQKTLAIKQEKDQPLWIEEPFGKLENLARTIKDVEHIGDLFKGTNKAIKTGKIHVILENLVTKDLLKEIKIELERDAIAKLSGMKGGPKTVASRDMISVSSSAFIILMSSPKVPIPAKTKGTDLDDANGSLNITS